MAECCAGEHGCPIVVTAGMLFEMRIYFAGIIFSLVLAGAAIALDLIPVVHSLGLGAKVFGLIGGFVIANVIPLPTWLQPGVKFTTKTLLRLAIVLLGLKITLFDIAHVGMAGCIVDLVMVATTLLVAIGCGRLLGVDRDTTLLVGAGSAICGASAALATESMLGSPAYKAALAVATVTVFGTILMALEPLAFTSGILPFATPTDFGVYVGSTIHEVAQVVAAGFSISTAVGETAVIVKLTRVMLLAPVLLLLLAWLRRDAASHARRVAVPFPWFVVGFIGMSVAHTFITLPPAVHMALLAFDDLLLTMAMVALGLATRLVDFRTVGWRPLALGGVLALWLALGGIAVTYGTLRIFGA